MLFTCCIASRAQSVVRLYPVDETNRDSSFRSYIRKLQSAVEARDPAALRKLVDHEVVVGPANDDKGWTRFVETWHPDDREKGAVWDALSDLLSLGFVREHPEMFVSPYLVWRFPRELNTATHLVVIRDQVALRTAPSANAPPAATLSFDIVQRLGGTVSGEGLGQWVRVRTLDGQTGYLNTRDVRSPSMPRAQFALHRGHWLLTGLEGGDQ